MTCLTCPFFNFLWCISNFATRPTSLKPTEIIFFFFQIEVPPCWSFCATLLSWSYRVYRIYLRDLLTCKPRLLRDITYLILKNIGFTCKIVLNVAKMRSRRIVTLMSCLLHSIKYMFSILNNITHFFHILFHLRILTKSSYML